MSRENKLRFLGWPADAFLGGPTIPRLGRQCKVEAAITSEWSCANDSPGNSLSNPVNICRMLIYRKSKVSNEMVGDGILGIAKDLLPQIGVKYETVVAGGLEAVFGRWVIVVEIFMILGSSGDGCFRFLFGDNLSTN